MSIADVLGARGADAVLRVAGMAEPRAPPVVALPGGGATLEELGRLEQAIEELYGPRASRGVLVRLGRARFNAALDEFRGLSRTHALAASAVALPLLPLELRLELMLNQIVAIANRTAADAARVEQTGSSFLVVYDACSCLYRSPQDHPSCFTTLGLLMQAVDWVRGHAGDVREVSCLSTGADACRFLIPTRPIDPDQESVSL